MAPLLSLYCVGGVMTVWLCTIPSQWHWHKSLWIAATLGVGCGSWCTNYRHLYITAARNDPLGALRGILSTEIICAWYTILNMEC